MFVNYWSLNCVFLDPGCTSIVAGKPWIVCHLSLSGDEYKKVIHEESNKVFKSGGRKTGSSIETTIFPFILTGRHILVKLNIMKSDIALFLSTSAIIKAKIYLSLLNDTAEIFGNIVDLNDTFPDHFCLPLREAMIDIK